MSQNFYQSNSNALSHEELQARGVNSTWIRKLTEIHNAGIQGFSLGIVKTAQPLLFFTRFTVLAFLFNWIYYLIKGMWKKALVFLGACVAIGIIVSIVSLISLTLGSLIYFVGVVGLMVYAGLAAPGDYYRHVVLKEDFWI